MWYRSRNLFLIVPVLASLLLLSIAKSQSTRNASKVVVQPDGTVDVPARSVPPSSLLTEKGKQYLSEHLHQMQDPDQVAQVGGVPRFMKPMIDRDYAQFAFDKKDERIGGVHVYTYTPKNGVSPRNLKRVLINLHGGGFSGCWPGCAELESIPIAALMKIKVVTVDYREGPQNNFPAASEDVARVYAELLKSYQAKSIGIYGCSAGGMLTSMSLAWFQTHNLPTPGAAGIYCASAGGFGGDAQYIALPLGEARIPTGRPTQGSPRGYMSTAAPDDPMASPISSQKILSGFPPTLLITATRDFAMSGTIHTDIALTNAGVHTELHVWDGMFHGFFYNADVPESRQAFDIMIKFFDNHLSAR